MITVKYQDLDPLQFSYSKSKLSLLLWQQYCQALLAKRKNAGQHCCRYVMHVHTPARKPQGLSADTRYCPHPCG